MSGVFFFQAEDGIRDLVRSRGLGDVYKRQIFMKPVEADKYFGIRFSKEQIFNQLLFLHLSIAAVSYTHLTLPTSDLV